MSSATPSPQHSTVVIIGAGSGGLAVAAQLRRAAPTLDITIVEPSAHHYYQPAWTLVGGGAYRLDKTRRPLAGLLPRGVRHVRDNVVALLPDERQVALGQGGRLGYDFLVVAAGLELQWEAIDGLAQALGKRGVTSNYHRDLAPYTWDLVRRFKGGTAIFTQPAGAIKCPGAPQKALYLSADHFRRHGVAADLQFRTAGAAVFGVAFYAKALTQIMASYGVQPGFGQHLVQVRGEENIAVFESTVDGQTVREEVAYDLLHVVPPQQAPDFIRQSPLADAAGWLEVDKHTLRHPRHPEVFGLGDCTSTPNSKTAAAVKNQSPVLVDNLLGALRGTGASVSRYDGYAGCPLTTSRGRVLLAEFAYDGVITPSFSADPRQPRRFYWWLKRSFMPWFYWNILLKGRRLPDSHKPRPYPEVLPPIQP